MFPMQASGGELNTNMNSRPAIFNNSLELAGSGSSVVQPVVSLFRLLGSKLDWLVATACSLVIIWLVFLLASKRTNYSPQRKLTNLSRSNHETSWRFTSNTIDGGGGGGGGGLKRSLGADNSTRTLVQLPFHSSTSQSRKLCAGVAGNYYGNFTTNGVVAETGGGADSELDMVQSCSQSSHYDDYAQHQLQQRLVAAERAAIYGVYAQSTLNNRAGRQQLKSSSLSGSSSTGGDSSIGSNRQGHHQLIRLNESAGYGQRCNTREFPGTMLHHNQARLASANVPLINGTHNSRINLEHQSRFTGGRGDQQQQSQGVNGVQQQRSLLGSEPIYDDVIYNQMIL